MWIHIGALHGISNALFVCVSTWKVRRDKAIGMLSSTRFNVETFAVGGMFVSISWTASDTRKFSNQYELRLKLDMCDLLLSLYATVFFRFSTQIVIALRLNSLDTANPSH